MKKTQSIWVIGMLGMLMLVGFGAVQASDSLPIVSDAYVTMSSSESGTVTFWLNNPNEEDWINSEFTIVGASSVVGPDIASYGSTVTVNNWTGKSTTNVDFPVTFDAAVSGGETYEFDIDIEVAGQNTLHKGGITVVIVDL